MKKYEKYYNNLSNEALAFIKENSLEEHIDNTIKIISQYLQSNRIIFDLSLDFFKDDFSKNFSILRIVVKCKNYEEYSIFYLWRSLCSLAKSYLPEDACSKIAIKLENER